MEIFDSRQLKAMRQLWKLMDKMPHPPACENFPDAFFPERGDEDQWHLVKMAKGLCAECPIKAACAEYGVNYEQHGIYGGLATRERQQIRARRGILLSED